VPAQLTSLVGEGYGTHSPQRRRRG
jgi:hypothetical protein